MDAAVEMAPAPTCTGMPRKALPYDVLKDFTFGNTLHGATTANGFVKIADPDCNATTFPPFPVIIGVDGGADGSATDGGTDGSATEGGTDGSATEGGTDGSATEGGTDAASGADASVEAGAVEAGAADVSTSDAAKDSSVADASDASAVTSCMEFSYNPDQCIVNTGGASDCWDGVIFSPSNVVGQSGIGICIADGAKHITFEARASRNVQVKFGGSGVIGGDGTGVTEFLENLTTSWQSFTLDGPTNIGDYNMASTTTSPGVWNGFSIVGIPDGMSGVYILVRNVRWTP
jgi:hypothetical protein